MESAPRCIGAREPQEAQPRHEYQRHEPEIQRAAVLFDTPHALAAALTLPPGTTTLAGRTLGRPSCLPSEGVHRNGSSPNGTTVAEGPLIVLGVIADTAYVVVHVFIPYTYLNGIGRAS
jgi:hypothetical protein